MSRKKINLKHAPYGVDYRFPKSKFYLGSEFKKTEFGYTDGSIAQYRGPNNEHVLEYEDYYKGHRDRADPLKDPLGHITEDAYELFVLIIGGIIASIYGLFLYRWRVEKKRTGRYTKSERRNFFIGLIILILIIISVIGIYFIVKGYRESKRKTVYC